MIVPGPLDGPLIRLIESIAFTGCAARLEFLDLPATLCRHAAEAQQALDAYDSLPDEREAAMSLYDFVDRVVDQEEGLSMEVLVTAALRISRGSTPEEGNLFLWFLVLAARRQRRPIPTALAMPSDDRPWPDSSNPVIETLIAENPWERAYLSRHPYVDPDELVRQLREIRETRAILDAIVSEADRTEVLSWGRELAEQLGIGREALASPWD